MDNTFAGVRILELAQYVFVPGGGLLLSDLGAEVIKVEPPGSGDPYRTLITGDGRGMDEVNIALEQNNRGKKSISIDLKSKKGHELFGRLLATADVFITSLRPQALARLGLDVEDVRKFNPKLIYVRGNGLGFKGPHSDRPGYDSTSFWTRGGFATIHMHGDHNRPVRPRGALGDHSGSLSIAFGIASALYKRAVTGEPSLVECSLLSTGMWVLSHDITASQFPYFNQLSFETRAPAHPLAQIYKTSDGRWIQLQFLHPDRYWPDLCRAIGLDDYVDDPRFAKNDQRSKNGVECAALIAETIGKRTWKEWEPIFEKLDAPWELAQTVNEMLTDPQCIANGYVVPTELRDGRKYTLVSGPVTMNGAIPTSYECAPAMGADTDDLLGQIGVSGEEIAALRSEGVVA